MAPSRAISRLSRCCCCSGSFQPTSKYFLGSSTRRGFASVASGQSDGPLAGIRVLDMTRVLAGPYCTQILGDLGAEIIKIEHPTRGDDTRAWGPPYAEYSQGDDARHVGPPFAKYSKETEGKSRKGPGESAYFMAVNRNKKSLGLSFQHPEGVKILHELAKSSDVLVENYIPGALKKYQMDYETIRKINPKLIYASITGYGQTGPYSKRAGYDVMVEAEMGLMHITGERNGPPVKVGVAVTDLTTGLYTVNSILASLISRSNPNSPTTGQGQHLDVALSDCQVATLANMASSVLISGQRDQGRWGTAHPSIVPYKGFKTSDGDIMLGGGNDRLFGVLCTLLSKPEWISDERFKTNESRVAHRKELEDMIEAQTRTKSTKEWLDILEGSGMPYAAINDVKGYPWHEHVQARGMVTEVDHAACGRVKLVSPPVKYSSASQGGGGKVRTAPPVLGQHTDEVLCEILGYESAQIEKLKSEGVVS